jgi:hypothetical protein
MKLRRYAAAATLLVTALGTAPAYALCALCTAEIRLDAGLADCFARRADVEIKQLNEAGKGFVIVDLRDCGSRGSLPTGEPADGTPAALDSRFVMDEAGLRCLSAQIEALDDNALTPNRVFDLTKDCGASSAQ